MRIAAYVFMLGLTGCVSESAAVLPAAEPAAQYHAAGEIPASGRLMISSADFDCSGDFIAVSEEELISSDLTCDDARTGTVTFQNSAGYLPASGMFLLNDGTSTRVFLMRVDEYTLLGRLEARPRRSPFFAPPI